MNSVRAQEEETTVEPLQVLAQAAGMYRQRGLQLLLLAALGQVLFVAGRLIASAGGNALWWAGHALFAPGTVMLAWCGAAMILAASAGRRGEQLSTRDCFERVAARFWRYTTATVLYWLLCSAGFLLFVLPGLFLGTVFSLAGCAAVLEAPSEKAGPLRRSYRLVSGNVWRVLVVMLLLWCLVAPAPLLVRYLPLDTLPRVLAGIGWCTLLWPFWTAAHVVIYGALKDEDRGEEAQESAEPGGWSCLVGCLSAVGLGLVCIGLLGGAKYLYAQWRDTSETGTDMVFESTRELEIREVGITLPEQWDTFVIPEFVGPDEEASYKLDFSPSVEGATGGSGPAFRGSGPGGGRADVPGPGSEMSAGLEPEALEETHLWAIPLPDLPEAKLDRGLETADKKFGDIIQKGSERLHGRHIPPYADWETESSALSEGGRRWVRYSLTWRRPKDEKVEISKHHWFTRAGQRLVVITAVFRIAREDPELYEKQKKRAEDAVKQLVQKIKIEPPEKTEGGTR